MDEIPRTFELREPANPEALVPQAWVEPWILVAGAIVILGCIALLAFRKKRSSSPTEAFLRDAARAEADASLKAMDPELAPRQAAVQASLILRKYLATAAGDPALFETHEEFVSRHEALKDFSDDAREATAHGFARLAAMKYALQAPGMETPLVISESAQLLETLHHGFRK